ncbi:MAG TPA: DUF1801 domain-containing protein [Pyrinomonadaceae bacterium]
MKKAASKKNAKNGASMKTVDEYIAAAPKEARSKLVQLRQTIKAVAPEAEEGISYGMPYYKYQRALVGFAAYKSHIGLYGALTEEQRHDFQNYETAKGSIRFPLDKPLPVTLIKKLIKQRIKNNETRIKMQQRNR